MQERGEPSGALTLFKELCHDMLVVVGGFDFLCDVRSGILQVLCNAAKIFFLE